MTEIKKLPHSQIEFEVTISWNDWGKYISEAVKEASMEIKVPGFRPGKAPKHLVEQRVGKGTILNSAGHKAVEKSYVDFIMKEKLDVIGQPQVEITVLEEEKDLKYKVVATVMPEVILENEYKKDVAKVNEEFKNKKIEIKEEELKLELDRLANSRVKLVTVMREARKNDSVEVDFEVKVDGEVIENGTSKKHPLIIGRGVFIPGFEDNLIGMREGEEKKFDLEFPQDYHKKELAGKPATFQVKMNLVQERQTPEVNDDFARSLGKFTDLESLKKNIQEGMEHEEKHKREEEKRAAFIEKIVGHSTVDLPDALVKEEIEKMKQEFEYQLQNMGMNLENYLEKIGKKGTELGKEWDPQARKRIISALSLQEIVKTENITVDSKEVEAEMNKTLQHYKGVKDIEKNIDMSRLYTYSKGVLENEKVFEFLESL